MIVGRRYQQVTDEVIQYALGFWGEEECSSMDPDVRDRILDRPRARELRSWQPPETSVKELREKIGGAGVSDDELLLRYFTSEEDVRAMQQAPARCRERRESGGADPVPHRALRDQTNLHPQAGPVGAAGAQCSRFAPTSRGALCEARTVRVPHRTRSIPVRVPLQSP